jgi:hypothetical protein
MGAIAACAPHEKLREGTDNLFLKWISSEKGPVRRSGLFPNSTSLKGSPGADVLAWGPRSLVPPRAQGSTRKLQPVI